jgi:hypothetical protein
MRIWRFPEKHDGIDSVVLRDEPTPRPVTARFWFACALRR